MNKRRVSTTNICFLVVTITIIIAGSSLLAACSPMIEVQARGADSKFDFDAAAENHALRWEAIGRGYEKLGMLNEQFDAGDVSAFRWNAIANGYQRQGLLNYHNNPDDLSAYRWIEMAKTYEKLGLLNYHDNPDDLCAYRWISLAQGYQRLGLLNE